MKIDKGIPISDRYARRRNSIARELEVGDSVLMDTYSDAKSLAARIVRIGHQSAVRKQRDGWRVWRVADDFHSRTKTGR